MNHDLAMAKMSLAGIYLQKEENVRQSLLSEAKKSDKHGMLTGQMKIIQQQMKKFNGIPLMEYKFHNTF